MVRLAVIHRDGAPTAMCHAQVGAAGCAFSAAVMLTSPATTVCPAVLRACTANLRISIAALIAEAQPQDPWSFVDNRVSTQSNLPVQHCCTSLYRLCCASATAHETTQTCAETTLAAHLTRVIHQASHGTLMGQKRGCVIPQYQRRKVAHTSSGLDRRGATTTGILLLATIQ